MRKTSSMTPAREKREQEKLRTAIYRWHRLGGSLDRIIQIAEVMYAAKLFDWSSWEKSKPDE
jgi:hypothetical protein